MDKAMNQNLNEFDADKNTENMLQQLKGELFNEIRSIILFK